MKRAFYFSTAILLTILILALTTQCQMQDEEIVPEEMSQTSATVMSIESSSAGCQECDHVVNSYVTDGAQLKIQPGDVICLDARKVYDRLVFRNIVGTRSNPVIIRNCGGVATIYSKAAFGLKFENSKYFKLTGEGPDAKYGIKVSTEKGFFITMEKFTTNFEISYVEVAGPSPNGQGDYSGFAGIGVKTSPYQDCELFTDPTRQAWIMRDVVIHNNYIHDTGGEGIYMGHGFYKGRKESKCAKMTYSHSIKGVKIYDNLIENVGYDGMQIKNANQNVEVYRNIVRNYGTKNHGIHNEGLFIGEGTTGKFYDNIIDTGTGNGCMVQGLGNLDIYNNQFLNSGEYGIYACHGSYVIRAKGAPFNFFNNTIVNTKDAGFVFFNDDGGPKRFINNLVATTGAFTKPGAKVEMRNNVFTNDVNAIGTSHNASTLSSLSVLSEDLSNSIDNLCRDKGEDLSIYGVQTDCVGNPRPLGLGFDIGAFEN